MFNQRKGRTFNYRPRFQEREEDSDSHDFQEQWKAVKPKSKRKGSVLTSLPALMAMLVALLILIYILDGYK